MLSREGGTGGSNMIDVTWTCHNWHQHHRHHRCCHLHQHHHHHRRHRHHHQSAARCSLYVGHDLIWIWSWMFDVHVWVTSYKYELVHHAFMLGWGSPKMHRCHHLHCSVRRHPPSSSLLCDHICQLQINLYIIRTTIYISPS